MSAAAPVRTRRGELTAERILDAAEALFAEKGFAGTTLRDVATAVGLRIPSLYNHFESKESLYAAVLRRGLGPVLRGLADRASGQAPREAAPFIGELMELLVRRPNLARLVQQEALTGGERLSPLLATWFRAVLSRAQESVAAMPGARTWREDELPLVVLALYHAFVGYFTIAPMWSALGGEELLDEEALRRHERFFVTLVERLLPGGAP